MAFVQRSKIGRAVEVDDCAQEAPARLPEEVACGQLMGVLCNHALLDAFRVASGAGSEDGS